MLYNHVLLSCFNAIQFAPTFSLLEFSELCQKDAFAKTPLYHQISSRVLHPKPKYKEILSTEKMKMCVTS